MVNATDLTFTVKDVIAIVVAAAGGVSFVLALRASNKSNHEKLEAVVQELEKHKMDTKEKLSDIQQEAISVEGKLERRIDKLDEALQKANGEISNKMDSLSTTVNSMNNSISQLTGYLRGKGDIP